MLKRRNAIQEKCIDDVDKTFGRTLIVTHEELARLRYKKEFPTNESRLCNGLVEKMKLVLRNLVAVMDNMPETYTAKLLSSKELESLLYATMRYASTVDRKKPKNKFRKRRSKGNKIATVHVSNNAPYSIQLAAFMLNFSLRTIVESMPEEFHAPLKQQIYPFLTWVNAIANYSQDNHGKMHVAKNYISFEMNPSFPANVVK